MDIKNNTILITGGASGIGLQFTKKFYENDNKIIICGRNTEKLKSIQEQFPEITTKKCDISSAEERLDLYHWVIQNYSDINVLVNNAGIQNRFDILKTNATTNWENLNTEIKSNFEATVQLSTLFSQYFSDKTTNSNIINVSSGLAFSPMAIAPIYSATKAAVHSFTVSLRHQLSNTNTSVYEVIPPAVNTDLGGENIHTSGADPVDFINEIFDGLVQGNNEIGYGSSKKRLQMSKEALDDYAEEMYHTLKNTI
ncbi:MAG: SDR family NAD(P)-dependent oxidoreductase [Staphylococcus equorum]|uniref:SDR family oxidoreductase n=1 Tax=Staphylococcus TaxID=1279 RepID=UPI0008537D29|nr:SDR family NAD(P)-dependent oxidoreductase [Staphylococcus equorum]MDG0821952.1 SDR family NAD(P)-dependent oxidoreductase [Staphylococcus equorum]MDG0838453.1 SDR family NAD(P)-dependent oxidoreductase [Staphylococcus equorum]MDK9877139.1 SDR family NAD(P)-dependent oxidoreductase [Staphylococcus equorum]MDN5829057.1 SDR family NAD(P)-dependent oxidoreductase [Staphylococcus equorum]MDN6570930.1 SDR family NAD(P)-dependent oxidoreductase [Staphylococcus equorum]